MQGSRKTWVDQNLNLWCLNIPAAFWYCWLVHGWSTVLEMLLRRLTCKMITHWPFVSWISCYFLSFPYWQLNQAGTFCSSHTPAMLPRHETETCVSAGCSLERLQTWPLFLVHSWGTIVVLKWMQNCKKLFIFFSEAAWEGANCLFLHVWHRAREGRKQVHCSSCTWKHFKEIRAQWDKNQMKQRLCKHIMTLKQAFL